MLPILKKNFALLKQYRSSVIYPLFDNANTSVMSGKYLYERINQTAAEILELCTGNLTVIEISEILAQRYHCDKSESLRLVEAFVDEALRKGYLTLISDKIDTSINVSGSFNVIFPFTAQIEVTKKCPLRCRHCFNNSGIAKKQEMTTDQIFVILDKLSSMGIKKIMITGGEPSARTDFIQILNYAAERFLAISLATNGYYITPDVVTQLSKLHNIVVQVSLDGNEEHHNYIRGSRDSFSKAVNAIRNLSDAKIPVVVASTFNSYNVNDVEYVTSLAKSLGAKQITYSVTNLLGRAKDNPELLDFSIDALLEDSQHLKKKYSDNTFYVHVNESRKGDECATSSCGRGCTQICVRENGDVSPCLQFNLAIGNLLNQEVDEIFNYRRMIHFLDFPEPDYMICGKCDKREECGGCAALAWDLPLADCPWKRKNIDMISMIDSLKI